MILPSSQPTQVVECDAIQPHASIQDTGANQNTSSYADVVNRNSTDVLLAETTDTTDCNGTCPICKIEVTSEDNGILCDMCNTWVHQQCLHMTDDEFQSLANGDAQWFCARCNQIKLNKIKWGAHVGEETIRHMLQNAYDTIIGWKKNLFRLPRGKCGAEFIKELTRLINLFVNKTQWKRLALPLVLIFVPLMLQKPSPKSKPCTHAKYLLSRLECWKQGDMESLLDEAKEIQKRLKSKRNETDKKIASQKMFINLMLQGKIGEAAKKINNEDSMKGVHRLNA